MGLFSFLFGSSAKESETSKETAVHTGISFDALLIDKLKEDHQELVKLFTAIKTAASEGHFAEIHKILHEFKLALQTHLAVENVRFYVNISLYRRHFHLLRVVNFRLGTTRTNPCRTRVLSSQYHFLFVRIENPVSLTGFFSI